MLICSDIQKRKKSVYYLTSAAAAILLSAFSVVFWKLLLQSLFNLNSVDMDYDTLMRILSDLRNEGRLK